MPTETPTQVDLSEFFGVGAPIEAGTVEMKEALKQTGMDFTVSQHNLRIDDPGTPYHDLPYEQKRVIVRDDTLQRIADGSPAYQIVQNVECVEGMAEILNQAAQNGEPLHLFRGGNVKNCQHLFLAARLPKDMEIVTADGQLIVHQYLIFRWSHTLDGKVSVAFVSYSPKYKTFLYTGGDEFERSFRHTKNAPKRMDEAKKYLADAYKAFLVFEKRLTELAGKPMDQNAYESFLNDIFPTPESADPNTAGGKRAITRAANKRTEITKRFNENKGKSALDGFIALCQHNDYDTTVKQKDKPEEEKIPDNELRIFSSLFGGTGNKAKKEALHDLLSWN